MKQVYINQLTDVKCDKCEQGFGLFELIEDQRQQYCCVNCISADDIRKAMVSSHWDGVERNLILVSNNKGNLVLCPHHYLKYKKILSPDKEESVWAEHCDLCLLDALIEGLIMYALDITKQDIEIIINKLHPHNSQIVKSLIDYHVYFLSGKKKGTL